MSRAGGPDHQPCVSSVAVGLGFIGYAMLHKIPPRASSAPAVHNSGMFTDEQLDETETKSLEAGIDYLKGLDASIARHRQQIGLEKR